MSTLNTSQIIPGSCKYTTIDVSFFYWGWGIGQCTSMLWSKLETKTNYSFPINANWTQCDKAYNIEGNDTVKGLTNYGFKKGPPIVVDPSVRDLCLKDDDENEFHLMATWSNGIALVRDIQPDYASEIWCFRHDVEDYVALDGLKSIATQGFRFIKQAHQTLTYQYTQRRWVNEDYMKSQNFLLDKETLEYNSQFLIIIVAQLAVMCLTQVVKVVRAIKKEEPKNDDNKSSLPRAGPLTCRS